MFGGIFDAGDGELVSDIPGNSDDEEVAEALIEQDLGAEAGVGAGEDDGVGDLTLCDFEAFIDILVGVCFEALAEPSVAFDNAAESVFGVGVELGNRFGLRLGGCRGFCFVAGQRDG